MPAPGGRQAVPHHRAALADRFADRMIEPGQSDDERGGRAPARPAARGRAADRGPAAARRQEARSAYLAGRDQGRLPGRRAPGLARRGRHRVRPRRRRQRRRLPAGDVVPGHDRHPDGGQLAPLDPNAGMDFSWTQYGKLFYAESLLPSTTFASASSPGWGLDWDRIRATHARGHLQRLQLQPAPARGAHARQDGCRDAGRVRGAADVVPAGEWSMAAPTSTPCTPPTPTSEAIRRGADELWVIWTVSMKGDWENGFVANYFQVIEAAANWRLKQVLGRIDASNAAFVADGGVSSEAHPRGQDAPGGGAAQLPGQLEPRPHLRGGQPGRADRPPVVHGGRRAVHAG